MTRPKFNILIVISFLTFIFFSALSLFGSHTVQGAPPFQGIDPTPTPAARVLPPNNPSRGLIYDGLIADGTCPRAFRIDNTDLCSHGPDLAPDGVNVKQSVAPIEATLVKAPNIQCSGDGASGNRYQVMYVRAANVTSRYNQYLASFKQWTNDADQIYLDSAAETGGVRHLRFVHDANCNLIIPEVVIAAGSDATFSATRTAVSAQGYNQTDRKYMMFVDATVYCGIGSLFSDDRKISTNRNNSGPSYARTDSGCWGGPVQAHESMHNLGGVQLSAPHTSGGYHCVDEWDRMCYSDTPNHPAMQVLCNTSSHDRLFDCNHDDYYHTNPPAGNYLATFWNSADNQFLIIGAGNCSSVGASNAAPSLRSVEADKSASEANGGSTRISSPNVIFIFLPFIGKC